IMPDRKMFWRIVRRLLAANRGRLFVILLALGAGAAVTAAVLSLQVDAKRRLTTEFRAFGPNVVIGSRGDDGSATQPRTMPESVIQKGPLLNEGNQVVSTGWLYLIANAARQASKTGALAASVRVVVAGYTGGVEEEMLNLRSTDARLLTDGLAYCDLGVKVASTLNVHGRDKVTLRNESVEEVCSVWHVNSYGGREAKQLFVHIETAQRLAQLPGQIGLIQVVTTGTSQSIERFIRDLQQRLPNSDVRPIRQFTEGEAKIYDRISGILSATVGLVLVLTGLCVMAAMTNVAMERRNDVGLMKAIGGATRRVLRLFLAEAASLGLTGRVIVDGVDLAKLSESEIVRYRAEKVGFVFQQFHLVPYLTALENVMLAQYFHSVTDEKQASEALHRVGLGDRLTHLPAQLSGGEQQRVAIARALINQPKLILADEPTGNLDEVNEASALQIFRELHNSGHTILMVTHDPDIARQADRRIELAHGHLQFATAPHGPAPPLSFPLVNTPDPHIT